MLFRLVSTCFKSLLFLVITHYLYVIESITESKFLELNQVVGAKSSSDGSFYRAKVIEKTDENNCNIMFIDFGFEENVNISDIVLLPIELQQVELNYYI